MVFAAKGHLQGLTRHHYTPLHRQTVYEKVDDQNQQRWSNESRNWQRIQPAYLNPVTINAYQKLNIRDVIHHIAS